MFVVVHAGPQYAIAPRLSTGLKRSPEWALYPPYNGLEHDDTVEDMVSSVGTSEAAEMRNGRRKLPRRHCFSEYACDQTISPVDGRFNAGVRACLYVRQPTSLDPEKKTDRMVVGNPRSARVLTR